MEADSSDAPIAALQVEYTPRQADLFEGYRVQYRKNRRARLVNAAVGLALLALIPAALLYADLPLLIRIMIAVWLGLIALAACSDRFWFLLGFGLIRARYRITLRFSLDGMNISAPGYHKDVAWSEYATVEETPDAFVLVKSSKAFFVVPKRGFHANDIQPFRNLLAMIFPQSAPAQAVGA